MTLPQYCLQGSAVMEKVLKVKSKVMKTEEPTYQCELAKKFVVTSHLSLSLAYFNLHLCLPISSCGKHLWKRNRKLLDSKLQHVNGCSYKLTKQGIKRSYLGERKNHYILVVPLTKHWGIKTWTAKLTGILSYMHLSTQALAMPRQQQAPVAASHISSWHSRAPAPAPPPRQNQGYQ